jgi:hypothetical protein
MSAAVIVPSVAAAIDDLQRDLPSPIRYDADGSGGAFVVVEDCHLGDGWTVQCADLAFHLPYNYPWAAIYPYYLTTESWPTGQPDPALQRVIWRGMQVVQISLRHTRWTPEIDNALGCVRQTLEWARRLR